MLNYFLCGRPRLHTTPEAGAGDRMTNSTTDSQDPISEENRWNEAQLARLASTGLERAVDVHCHCLPALDDGPPDIESAIDLCRELAEDGITSVFATPHQLGKYDLDNSPERIRRRIQDLNEALHAEQIPLEVLPGADVRIDERLPRLVAEGEVFTLGDQARHLLLELPHSTFCEPRPVIERLAADGVQCIMTHPERHRYLGGQLDLAAGWIRAGAVIQITAGSLLGDFGRYAFDYAWRLLANGLASLVATDAHDAVRRPPRMTAAMATIQQHHSADVAQLVCGENPLRVWRSEAIEVTAV